LSRAKLLVEYSHDGLLPGCRGGEFRKEGPIADIVRASAALTSETNMRGEARRTD
jgi:hypothetical protein